MIINIINMFYPAKNFESESKFKSTKSKRMPKRVALSSVENNCSFGSWSSSCSVKRYITYKDYD